MRVKDNVVLLKYSEKRNVLSWRLKEESSRVPDVLEEIVPDVVAKVWESAKAIDFAVEALDFEHACVWQRAERAGRTVKV